MRCAMISLSVAVAVAACGQDDAKPEAGDAARWEVDSQRPPSPSDTTVRALVSRVGCANGLTGRVLTPGVSEQKRRVVITFTVERRPDGDASCPGNNLVPRTVELKEPLGDRPLFDGSCEGPAQESTGCKPRQVWPAP